MRNRLASADAAAGAPVDRYHPVLAVLHWLLAVLLFAALAQAPSFSNMCPMRRRKKSTCFGST